MKISIVTSGILLAFACTNVLLAKPDAGPASRPASGFWITEYGAVGDGKTLCTEAINKAIDAAAQAGGGIVYLPAGTWLSGTIFLKSNVILHLEQGATLLGSSNVEHYPEIFSSVKARTNQYAQRSLIYAYNAELISIEGDGIINGNGAAFPRPHDYGVRPMIIRFHACRDVRIEDITVKGGANWLQQYLDCERVRVDGIHVFSFAHHNNDGITIDMCRDFVLANSVIHAYDDAIALKSGGDKPSERVLITNCVARSYASAIKMGTDSSGGFRDVTVTNCIVQPVSQEGGMVRHPVEGLTGVELLLVDGGEMDGVTLSNLSIKGYQVALGVRLGDRGIGYVPDPSLAGERKPTGTVKNISINNIVIQDGGRLIGISLLGHVGHPIENISLSDITFVGPGGGDAEVADRIVPERARNYPQMAWYGEMPSFGLYARHIRGLRLSNIHLETATPDHRHALVLDDVQDADLNGISCMPAVGTNALFKLAQTSDVMIRGCRPKSANGAFVKVDGEHCSDIALTGNDFTHVRQVMELAGQASSDAIRQIGNFEPTYKGASVISPPLSQFVKAGSAIEFTVRAQNATAYEWYKQTSEKDILVASHKISAQKNTLKLTDVTADDEGVYYCVVKNKEGDDTSATAELRLKKLIGRWQFDGNANDSSGFDHHGKIHGGAEFVKTGDGEALSFDGKDDFVEIPAEALVPVGDEISIMLWQYGADSQPRRDFIFTAKRKNNELGFECLIPYHDETIIWRAGGGDRIDKAASAQDYKNAWHQWCFVKNATTGEMAIYLDGKLWASATGKFNTDFSSNIVKFAIGAAVSSEGQLDGPYAGKIRDFKIYNYALEPDTVAHIYSISHTNHNENKMQLELTGN